VTELIIIFVLILANGVFAGAEIAVVALRSTRVQELAEQGRRSARAVLALRDQPERFLATVQVGITVVGATAAAFGGASVADRLAAVFADIPWLADHAEGLALASVISGVSFLSIVIGELVPKSLALRGAERYALLIARPLLALSWLARPVVWLLSSSANLILKPLKDQTTFTETRHSARELQQLVGEASKAGTIHPEAGEIASRALELTDLTAEDVMVPRRSVIAIPRDATPQEVQTVLLEHKHSRVPVYDGDVDNIVGYVMVKDVLAFAWERDLIVLQDIIRPPYFVPESKRAVDLLKDMRAEHIALAIIVDEHGGFAGIITMEDLLEELVGEIYSEHARASAPDVVKQADGSSVIPGTMPIRDANRALGIDLPDDGEWTTVAGLCLSLSGEMPKSGDTLRLSDAIQLEVVDASQRRIRSVRVHVKSE
jgi:putative hemolysin